MTQDGIQFTVTQNSFTTISPESDGKGRVSIDTAAKLNAGKINKIINAVAIDWNAPQLPNSSDTAGNKEIKSTGDLLNLINEMNKRIYALTAAVIALSNK